MLQSRLISVGAGGAHRDTKGCAVGPVDRLAWRVRTALWGMAEPMPRYWFFISNRSTRQCIDVVAESACLQAGWRPADCVVITVGEMRQANGEAPPAGVLPMSRSPQGPALGRPR
jgi:hypothetical protein